MPIPVQTNPAISTDDKSNLQYWKNPDYKRITRVVRENDPIPMVPARPSFGHVGSELILREGRDYAFVDAPQADRLSTGNFWRDFGDANFKDHAMELYLTNIQGKIQGGAHQVAYSVN